MPMRGGTCCDHALHTQLIWLASLCALCVASTSSVLIVTLTSTTITVTNAVQELWDMTAPGGLLLLAVPSWYQDQQSFPSARVYGPLRLPKLVQQDPWEVMIVFVETLRSSIQ